MWQVAGGYDWATLNRLSQGWANSYELALARRFVSELDQRKEDAAQSELTEARETGIFYHDIEAREPGQKARAEAITKLLADRSIFGLKAEAGLPERPEGPSIACRVRLAGSEALVAVAIPDVAGTDWKPLGEFKLTLSEEKGEALKAEAIADALAAGLVGRLVRAHLEKGPKVKGQATYTVRIDNGSPMILNALALSGAEADPKKTAAVLGLCVPPGKHLTLPASQEVVDRLGLKDGVRIIAADLSGL
jgi:hypothetical protein